MPSSEIKEKDSIRLRSNTYFILSLICGVSFLLLLTLSGPLYFRYKIPYPGFSSFLSGVILLSVNLAILFGIVGVMQSRLQRKIASWEETLGKSIKIQEGEFKDRQATLLQMIRFLVGFIESKDPYRGGHSERVCQYALKIAESLGITNGRELNDLVYACYLHDLGRIFIPRHVWDKPGELTQEDYQQIKQHPVFGETVLSTLPGLVTIAQFVRHHHEREDGLGYPDSLSGNALPLIPKIIAVANAYDAMSSLRPYRPPFPPEVAQEELRRCSGLDFNADIMSKYGFKSQSERRFDPHVVTAFLGNGKKIWGISKKKIMIVDDNYLTCWSLATIMTKEGYEVTTAENGIVALEKIREKSVDMVITDLIMPEMDGFELMEEVKKISPAVPVVIMTCYYLPENAREAKQKGAFEFVEKPLKPEKLQEIIRKALPA